MTYKVESRDDMAEVARIILTEMELRPIVLLDGPMGSGKTTLVTLLMEQMDPSADVSSPTYSIVQVYDTVEGPIYHFDLFRMNTPEELLDFGFEEYLDSGRPCLIEWPDLAQPLLPEEGLLRVDISYEGTLRTVSIS